jgi:hypothetical protein
MADQFPKQQNTPSPQRPKWLDLLGLFGLGMILVFAMPYGSVFDLRASPANRY